MNRSAWRVLESVRGLLNSALIAQAQMKNAHGSIDRNLATQRYTAAVDGLVAELAVLKRSSALAVISEYLQTFDRACGQ